MKNTFKNAICLTAAICAAAFTASINSARAQDEPWNQQYRNAYEVPLGQYTGRSPFFGTTGERPAPPPPVVRPAPKPEYTAAETCWGLVRLYKKAPAAASVGDTIQYELTAVATCDVMDVTVIDMLPDNVTYVSSNPEGTVAGKKVTWKFDRMKRGDTKTLLVAVKADREGELVNCATVTALPITCVTTIVGKPVLSIEKSGPATAIIGSDVTYRIVVANKGSSVAQNVVVTDEVPEGLTHASGQKKLSYNVGDLGPGQSKEIGVLLKAAKTGKWCNNSIASASNHSSVNDDACTTVLQPGLRIVKNGDKEQFINRNAKYQIEVENIGDTTLTSVTVVDTAPNPTVFVSADGATIAGNTATWNVGTLAPKEKRSYTVVLTSRVAGNYCNSAVVSTAEGLRESAQACTLWKGVAGILLEMVDDPDPIMVGQTTTYTIRITNQGNADLHNITAITEFEAAVQPVNTAQGRIDGQKVTWPTVPTLAPKASVTYTVTVKGLKAADSRNKTTINCDETGRPVVEDESTTIY